MFRDALNYVKCEGEQKFIKIGRHFNFWKKPSILGYKIIPGIFFASKNLSNAMFWRWENPFSVSDLSILKAKWCGEYERESIKFLAVSSSTVVCIIFFEALCVCCRQFVLGIKKVRFINFGEAIHFDSCISGRYGLLTLERRYFFISYMVQEYLQFWCR